MIWRKIEKRLEAFYKANGRYALLVDGARQVGKTYSIEEFGRTHYDSVVKILCRCREPSICFETWRTSRRF